MTLKKKWNQRKISIITVKKRHRLTLSFDDQTGCRQEDHGKGIDPARVRRQGQNWCLPLCGTSTLDPHTVETHVEEHVAHPPADDCAKLPDLFWFNH